MEKDRVVAFSDGVIAVIITIMVLEMKAPHATDLSALRETIPVFLSYVLSFVYVAIYWSNHHHFFTWSTASTAGCSGRISICCSGFRLSPSRRAGWARTSPPPFRPPSTACRC